MTSVTLSAIGLILAIAVFIILCMKGTGAIFASVIATMIIALFANGGFTENFFTVFIHSQAAVRVTVESKSDIQFVFFYIFL